ncbi:protein ASPARTIC PROTEASE IN GUARD CELL 1 [Argentina anserina]|uniref:protein ASPARTIC PROTEASE IN GUARD CELL 1 n=1 Tax=Argentina anserina TaxID=57926 RepID=UPI0021767581|nr:protein ASPARTIC PROTEASE IN GUARD CELL 1 [Potentilla anserina]
MAPSSFFLFLFTFTFSSLILTTLSRTTLLSDPSTTTLDVADSLSQAHDVISFDPKTLEPLDLQEAQEAPLNSSSVSPLITLQLHPRESISNSHHSDYKSLVLSRLARDSARVNSLNIKLQLALQGVDRADLEPMQTSEIRPEALSTPVTSGISLGSGEYFTRVGVGSPARQFYMVLDTGSDVNWLQCQPCTDCYQQSDPVFNPTGSSTFRQLTCDAPQCAALHVSACRNDKCLYQVAYGDGSYTVGDFVSETMSFGSAIKTVALGCGHDNEGLFVGAAGLLGLGGGTLSLPSQVKATSISYCLVNRDSSASSTLEFNSPAPGDSVIAPLLKNRKVDTFYYVGLTGFSVGGRPVSIPPSIFQMDEAGNGGIIVDSGTAITRLQTAAYNGLRDAFKRLTPDLPSAANFALFDTCYNLAGRTSVRVPTVSFLFSGGKSLALPAKNYLIPVDKSGTFCFAFAPTSSALSIIGNVQQQGTRVSYDIANNRVGFSPNKC